MQFARDWSGGRVLITKGQKETFCDGRVYILILLVITNVDICQTNQSIYLKRVCESYYMWIIPKIFGDIWLKKYWEYILYIMYCFSFPFNFRALYVLWKHDFNDYLKFHCVGTWSHHFCPITGHCLFPFFLTYMFIQISLYINLVFNLWLFH